MSHCAGEEDPLQSPYDHPWLGFRAQLVSYPGLVGLEGSCVVTGRGWGLGFAV